jgi:hypothetical protein
MNETLKNIIIADLQKLIDDSRLDGCGCTSGDYQNPPEQCDACWARLELDDIREWKSDAEHQLNQCDVCWNYSAGAPHYIPEWFLIYARDMAAHELSDENLTVLFIYHILPILSEELK